MARVTVIGDVGGHADHLLAALAGVGAYPRVPDDAFVIQVGDLVDRGPDSPGVLELVDTYLSAQPERWIQLIGDHDAQYLPDGSMFYRASIEGTQVEMLRSFKMGIAAAVTTADEDYLVTHAGCGNGRRWTGRPGTPGSASAAGSLSASIRSWARPVRRSGPRSSLTARCFVRARAPA